MLCILFQLYLVYGQIGKFHQPNTSFDGFKIISFNAHQLIGFGGNADSLANFLKQQNADILLIQEFGNIENWQQKTEILERFKNQINLKFGHFHSNAENVFGLAIFSRFPIEFKEDIFPAALGEMNHVLHYELQIESAQKLNLVHAHLASNNVFREGQINNSLLEIYETMQMAGERRNEQIEAIAFKRKLINEPLIMVGDFNVIPLSNAYWRLKGDLWDGALEAGIGNNFTLKNYPIRIDYFLGSRGITIANCEAIANEFSDHKLLKSSFLFSN